MSERFCVRRLNRTSCDLEDADWLMPPACLLAKLLHARELIATAAAGISYERDHLLRAGSLHSPLPRYFVVLDNGALN